MLTITPLDEIIVECQEYDNFLNTELEDDLNVISERGNKLIVIMARTGKMMADARYWLNDHRKQEVDLIIDEFKHFKLSAKVQNAKVDSICKEEQLVLDWCERLNRTATHQLDWMRTKLSFIKEELKLTRSGY
jgi:hypothetical protein